MTKILQSKKQVFLIAILLLHSAVSILFLLNDNLTIKVINRFGYDRHHTFIVNKWTDIVLDHNSFIQHSSDSIAQTLIYAINRSKNKEINLEAELQNLEIKIDAIYEQLTNIDFERLSFIPVNPETMLFFTELSNDYSVFFNDIYHIDLLYGGSDRYASHGRKMTQAIEDFPEMISREFPEYMRPHTDRFRMILIIETSIVLLLIIISLGFMKRKNHKTFSDSK